MKHAEHVVSRFRSFFPQRRLILVSNREPYVARRLPGGGLTRVLAPGGLTAALDPVMRALGGTWIAWGSPPSGEGPPGPDEWQDRLAVPPQEPAYDVRRLRLSDSDVRNYYHGYANQSLWPLCHNLLEHVRFRDRFWKAYQDVNAAFARAVVDEARDDALVWLQDYHLALAPGSIRRDRPSTRLLHFWHIPWPPWLVYRICPNHRALLEGLLANDLIAFHLENFRDNFIRCCEQDLDVLVDWRRHAVVHRGHVTAVRAHPISIDAESFRELASRDDIAKRVGELRARFRFAGLQIGIGVDRLDYSKGILERLEALRILFTRHPEHVRSFTFIQVGAPSRSEILAYADLQERVQTAVERLNKQFGEDDWRPVLYIPQGLTHEELAALYRLADVAVVSSLQDGMNLVAKEFVAAQVDKRGVLCLSEFAGAAEEFPHAIPVNPFYSEGFAEDIHRALVMPREERRERMERMQAILDRGDVYSWIEGILADARAALDLAGRRRRRGSVSAEADFRPPANRT
jgi:trehalose 6-phosphate synthase